MKRISYFIIILIIPLMAFQLHKYYVSMCEIEYIEEKQSIQIVLGLFIDDLEVTLNKDHNKTLFLDTEKEYKQIDSLYINYLKAHLSVTVNNTPGEIAYIGKVYDVDVVRFYLEIPNIQSLNSLEVSNTALLRDFDDQKNIVKIKVKKLHKTFYLDKRNDKGLLNF